MIRSIHQKRLYPCVVRLQDVTLKGAGFFPFFDRQGMVHAYMLVWPASPWIVMLDARSDLIVRTRPLTLDVAFGRMQDLRRDRFERYRNLWHYDPWWLLGETRYTSHPAVPMLKATNAVHILEDHHDPGWFSRDLTRTLGDLTKHLPEPRSAAKNILRDIRKPAPPWRPRRTWPGLC